jgi:hypothetical protein
MDSYSLHEKRRRSKKEFRKVVLRGEKKKILFI